MHKKGKNKKGKPNIAQNEAMGEEKIDKPEVQSVEEITAPMIVSEEVPEIKEDAPKKPKRNKGKKKKGEDNISDDVEDTPKQDTIEEIVPDAVSVLDEFETVLPIARKKKNKKKSEEQLVEVPPNKDDLPTVSNEDTDKELLLREEKQSITKEAPQEQDPKSSKKKNKKKKRNDSEKSDKDELSCTAAFQKLLVTTEDLEEKPIDENKAQQPLVDIPLNTNNEEIKFEELKDTQKFQEISPPVAVEMSSNVHVVTKLSPIVETKRKKKNKKDKKQCKVEEESGPFSEPYTSKGTPINILSPPEVITKELDIITEPIKLSREELTSKTNIAKPVDKKRKEHHDPKTIDTPENILGPIKSQDLEATSYEVKDIYEQATTKVTDIIDATLIEPLKEDNTKLLELSISDSTVSKKPKKTPKVQKQSDIKEEQKPILKDTIKSEIKSSHKETLINLSEDFSSVRSIQQTIDTKSELLTVKPLQEVSIESKCGSNLDLTKATTADNKDKVDKIPGKKRKKSPKLPIKSESSSDQPISARADTEYNIKETTGDDVLYTQNSKEPISIEKDDTIRVSKLEDIEIRSVKTDESEDSTCEATPDILYPRSASQQLLDNNNNMVIREILPAEQSMSTDMPLVLGLVEAPKTPEPDTDKNIMVKDISLSALPTKSTAITTNQKTKESTHKEKTDLKSKMMEVNKDMEGLRRSIEKSLAELTAIEKSEEEVDKKFKKVKECKEVSVESATISTDDTIIISTETSLTPTANPEVVSSDATTAITESLQQNTKKDSKLKVLKDENIDTQKLIEDELLSQEKQMEAPEITSASVNQPKLEESTVPMPSDKTIFDEDIIKNKNIEQSLPTVPARKDQKGKHKKKRGRQEGQVTQSTTTAACTTPATTETKDAKESDKDKSESKNTNTEKGKQQSNLNDLTTETEYEPIEHFEDALTSSVDDVNTTFEMIVSEGNEQTNPKINIIAPDDDKITKVQPPKNLLGRPDLPVSSNKRDYKKEKNKSPSESQAKVKIKDCVDVEKSSKNTQTFTKIIKNCNIDANGNEEYVYKYSFRKVFLQSSCHVCKKDLVQRVSCSYCNLVFYCSGKHKEEDWPQHQALCFAVSTLVHLKDQKHIYADAKNVTGHDYRLLRMQMIVSSEKVLKRRLVPWEQEALLYPRMCATVACREWKQGKLKDCEGCGQISYCTDNPDHLPKTHQRWCKSYSLYQKLVSYQQTKGRLEPKLPSRVMKEQYQMPEKFNEVLASMYEEKIDMNDIQYAALTQIATAPLTAAYGHQVYRIKNPSANGMSKKSSFTIHVVGAELQFEADALVKWEVFFLHLQPRLQELKVVLINYNLNPSNLPLDLLGKIKLCNNCSQSKRRVIFSFQDKKTYSEYRTSEEFIHPDLVCAFNPSIQRSSIYNGKDPWPATINTIIKMKTPWIITAYSITELHRDFIRIKECSEVPFSVISEPKYNSFASVRPDRNFISDDEMPLLFKNYCYTILCG